MKRKGLGKGLGQGYRNLVPMDSYVHALNACGVKSKHNLDAKKYLPGVKPTINTLMGEARYVGTEIEDEQGRWDDDYNVRDGYFVIHDGDRHHVYELEDKSVLKRIEEARSLNARALYTSPEDKIFKLEVEQAITVPSTNYDQPISQKEFKRRVDEVQRYLSKEFGGETTIQGQGGYVAEDGRLIEEPVQVVTSFAEDTDFIDKQRKLLEQIKEWRKEWNQESIAYQVEDDLYIVGG